MNDRPCLGRVGYWFNAKKTKTFRVDQFRKICREAGLDLVKIDLDDDLTSQGPFHIILHKISKIITSVKTGDEVAARRLASFKNYLGSHPEIIVLDSVEALETILNRSRHAALAQMCRQSLISDTEFFVPKYLEIKDFLSSKEMKRKLEDSALDYPFICKPLDPLLKEMMLIFSDEGLLDIQPPCLLQEFVNHNAVMYKVYCIGDECHVVPRKSLRSFCKSQTETIFFSSTDISKSTSKSHLTEPSSEDECHKDAPAPDINLFKSYAKLVQSLCNLNLFGLDFVISTAGNYAFVDINFFPGYCGVPEVHQKVCQLLLDKLEEQRARKAELV